ncbi:prolyl oligopeptidase family serine peptidase [Microbacterium sp. NPDC058342]|uniref:S9 family peptidase n=1 Tax=Microbacterium sp. NPDC058342 TaxID=3346454 RepID=UPI00365AAD57
MTTRQERYRSLLDLASTLRGGRISPIWSSGRVAFEADGVVHIVDGATGERTRASRLPQSDVPQGRHLRSAFKIGRPPVSEVPEPRGRYFATEVGDDLALRWSIDDRISPLTDDGTPDHRWEVKGSKWSPDGLQLLTRRVDTREMERFPVVHWLKPNEEVEFFPAGRVGGAVESTSLHIVRRISRRVVAIDSGPEPEQDLRPLGWSPDGREAYFIKTNRFKKPFTLMAADPESGATRVVYEQHVNTWVSYWEKGMGCTLLPSGSGHIWLAERDGWAHLHLHDMDGAARAQITSGDYAVTRLVAIDEPAGWVYFEAHSDRSRPYDTHVCRARLDGSGGFEQLTTEPGTHRAQFSPDASLFVDTHASMDRVPASDLRRADGTTVARLDEADPAVLDVWTAPEEFTVLADDGETVLHGQLYLPADFDRTSTYPVIESIYAGPNSAFVPTMIDDDNAIVSHALAQLGFAVVMVDGRGTPERSKEFHDWAYGNFADTVIPDHVAALRGLAAERPYLDLSRVGVYGRSYGGYYTARALLEAPETYHVGVAVNGVYEMREGNGPGPIECVMGPLEDNIEGYDRLDLHAMVDRLQGKLLIVHGTSDVNVPFSASLQFTEALVRAGKPFDFLPVNEQPHHFTGEHGVYLGMAKGRYFTEHLGVDAL